MELCHLCMSSATREVTGMLVPRLPLCPHHSLSPQPWVSQVVVVKNPPASTGDTRDEVSIPGLGTPLEEEMAAYSSILARIIPRTEKPSRLHFTGSPRLRYEGTCFCTHTHTHPTLSTLGSHDVYRVLLNFLLLFCNFLPYICPWCAF